MKPFGMSAKGVRQFDPKNTKPAGFHPIDFFLN
jgi:hypothetical protein